MRPAGVWQNRSCMNRRACDYLQLRLTRCAVNLLRRRTGLPGRSAQPTFLRAAPPALRSSTPRRVAGRKLAIEAVVNSPPDGYALLLTTGANFINATLYKNLKFNFMQDTAPVIILGREPNAMVVHPDVPTKSLADVHRLCQGQSRLRSPWRRVGNWRAIAHLVAACSRCWRVSTWFMCPIAAAGSALVGVLGGQAQDAISRPLSATIGYVHGGQSRANA